MNRSTLAVLFILVLGGISVAFSAPPVVGSGPTGRLGFWIDERDMWSGVGLAWTPQQFVTNYFESPPYPSAMLFATAMSPDGPKSPGALGEAQWLGQVASLAQSSGLNVKIIILFFVNLSGSTKGGVADQTSLLTQFVSALGSHSNIYGAEYEIEYYGNTQAEEQTFYSIIHGAGYTDILNPGTSVSGVSGPSLGYSTYPYFSGAIPSALASNTIGYGYGETGAPSGNTPNPAWTQTTVQKIVSNSPANSFVFLYSDDGGSGQPGYELWNWSTLRQWIYTDSSYSPNYILSTSSPPTTTSTTTSTATSTKTSSTTSVATSITTSTTTSTSATSTSSPSMALDGDVVGYDKTGSTPSVSLTTSSANDVIIVLVSTSVSSGSPPTVLSISSPHVSWESSARGTGGDGATDYEEWYGIASSALSSETITVHLSSSPADDSTITAFGISGANTASPFDSHSGLPAWASGSGGSPSVSISTSNAKDFIFGVEVRGCPSANGAHYSTIVSDDCNANYTDVFAEYQIVSSTTSSFAVNWGSTISYWDVMGDVVVGR
jgi:hypothetical protein